MQWSIAFKSQQFATCYIFILKQFILAKVGSSLCFWSIFPDNKYCSFEKHLLNVNVINV